MASRAKRADWTPDMDDLFRSIVPGSSTKAIIAAMRGAFGVELTVHQVKARKDKLGVRSTAGDGRFKKGQAPHNKGKTWDEYMPPESQARSRMTCFEQGHLPHNAADKPIGYERVSRDGYVEVKVRDGLQREANGNFRLKHHVAYEQAHGAIPEGCHVVFADGDRLNFDPANLVAVPRSLWTIICREHIPYADRETLGAAMDVASARHAIHAAKTRPRRCKACGAEFKPRFARQRTCDACLGRI